MSKLTKEKMYLLASRQIKDGADCRSAGYSAADCRSAGYSLADCRSAGYSLADCLSAGYSAAACLSAGYGAADLKKMEDETPLVEKPYSKMLAGIKARDRKHDQSTFGPDCDPETNLCKTPMCTAGHLVNLCGEAGYKLKEKYGWVAAATLIHSKAHPDEPPQNFGTIPQEWAMAYIETMAEKESAK